MGTLPSFFQISGSSLVLEFKDPPLQNTQSSRECFGSKMHVLHEEKAKVTKVRLTIVCNVHLGPVPVYHNPSVLYQGPHNDHILVLGTDTPTDYSRMYTHYYI